MSNKHELQLRALMEALPFASWFKDDNGNFEQVNELLLALLGKEATEVIGRSGREVQGEEDAGGHEEAEKEVLKSGEIRESTQTGGKQFVRSVYFPVTDKQGKIIGTGAFQEDTGMH